MAQTLEDILEAVQGLRSIRDKKFVQEQSSKLLHDTLKLLAKEKNPDMNLVGQIAVAYESLSANSDQQEFFD